MQFSIHENNAAKVARSFTATPPRHFSGYTKSAVLKANSAIITHYYEISIVYDIIVCTVRNLDTHALVAIVDFTKCEGKYITVTKAELFRNGSNYPYRTETHERYLKKYDQIACIVHGAITAGLLFNADTTEPTTPDEDTKTTDMETFTKAYNKAYRHLYQFCGVPSVDDEQRTYCAKFDESWEEIKDIARAFSAYRGDFLTSDRECAAFMIALDKVGTPTTPQDAPQGTESTTGEETHTEGAKAPYSATDGATTEEKTTDGKKITTPANDTRQRGGNTPNGNEITDSRTDGGKTITATTTPPRHACENAPQRTERGRAIETTTPRHKTPSRGKYKATHARTPKFGKVCARTRVPSGALFSAGAG